MVDLSEPRVRRLNDARVAQLIRLRLGVDAFISRLAQVVYKTQQTVINRKASAVADLEDWPPLLGNRQSLEIRRVVGLPETKSPVEVRQPFHRHRAEHL